MSKQRTKKPTTGERIAKFLCFDGSPDHKTLARRIDRAIAAAVRKERKRCCKIMHKHYSPSVAAKNAALNEIRSNP